MSELIKCSRSNWCVGYLPLGKFSSSAELLEQLDWFETFELFWLVCDSCCAMTAICASVVLWMGDPKIRLPERYHQHVPLNGGGGARHYTPIRPSPPPMIASLPSNPPSPSPCTLQIILT